MPAPAIPPRNLIGSHVASVLECPGGIDIGPRHHHCPQTGREIIQGDWPWHANPITTDPRSEWHDVRGRRSESVLFEDGHAVFYKFPADLAQHLTDTPDPNYLWW